jgi:hypothetical protein
MEQRIELLNPTLAIPDDAVLRVADMRMTGIPGTWMVRMQCFPIGECLSFHVLLHGEQSSSRAFAPIRQFGSTAVSSRSTIVASSGDRIQLVEQRDGLRITVGGVCLQSGSLGEKIYVRNLATHRVVLARIVARGKLEVQ